MLDRIGSESGSGSGWNLTGKNKKSPTTAGHPRTKEKKEMRGLALRSAEPKGKSRWEKVEGGKGGGMGDVYIMYIPGVTSTGAAYQMLGSVLFFGGGGGPRLLHCMFSLPSFAKALEVFISLPTPPHTSSSQPTGGYEIPLFLM